MAGSGWTRAERTNTALAVLVLAGFIVAGIAAQAFRNETRKGLDRIADAHDDEFEALGRLREDERPVRFTIEYTKMHNGVAHKILVPVREGDPEGAWIGDVEKAAKQLEEIKWPRTWPRNRRQASAR